MHADPTFDILSGHPGGRISMTRTRRRAPYLTLLGSTGSAFTISTGGLERQCSLTRLSPIIFLLCKILQCEGGWRHCHWRWCYLREASHGCTIGRFNSDRDIHAVIVKLEEEEPSDHPLFFHPPSCPARFCMRSPTHSLVATELVISRDGGRSLQTCILVRYTAGPAQGPICTATPTHQDLPSSLSSPGTTWISGLNYRLNLHHHRQDHVPTTSGFPLSPPPSASLFIGAVSDLRSLRLMGAICVEVFLPSVPIHGLRQGIQDTYSFQRLGP